MNWLHAFWFNYEWPSIKGNGPEDFTSLILVAVVTAVLVPAVRHWIERHVHSEFAHLHAKIDHVILHSKSIPNEVPGLPAHRQPKSPPDTPHPS